MLVFCCGWKTGEPGEKHPEQGKTQEQTQPIYGTEPESNPSTWWEMNAFTQDSYDSEFISGASLTPTIMDRIYIVNASEVKSVAISARNADASSATPPNLDTLHLETNWKRVQRK